MIFIVTLIALLVERFFDCSHLRNWNWFYSWQRIFINRLGEKSAYLILASSILPLLLITIVISLSIHNGIYGLLALLFDLAVLVYCLGPKNLLADIFASVQAFAQENTPHTFDSMKMAFDITDANAVTVTHRTLIEKIFVEANKRIFAVVFWFVILGPAGAVLYRTISLSVGQHGTFEVSQKATQVQSLLDWIPIRIFTFFFALGGHFSKVFLVWRKNATLGTDNNETMLVECGLAALNNEELNLSLESGMAEKNVISLLDRAFIIGLVVIALVSLILA